MKQERKLMAQIFLSNSTSPWKDDSVFSTALNKKTLEHTLRNNFQNSFILRDRNLCESTRNFSYSSDIIMDFGDEDELDFEEDLPENESKKIDEPENAEEKTEDFDMNGCDQYLQIDCLEDEEDLLSKVTLDNAQPESTVNDKEPNTKNPVKEDKEKSNKKKENKQGENLQNRNSGKVNRKKRKEKAFGVPLYRTPGSVCPKKWRSGGNNFTRPRGQNVGQGLNNLKGLPLQYPKLHHFSQNYFQNQSDFVSLLGLNTTKNQNMQQINNLLIQCSNPILEVRNNFIRNSLLGQCGNAILNQFQCNDYYRFKDALQQKLAVDANSKNFPVRSINGFKTNSNRGILNEGHSEKNLPEGQKELKLKKEARLLRFMNDETNRKETKSTGNIPEKLVVENLNLEDEYFKKMEEQKRKRQEIFNLKEKQNHCNEKCTPDTLEINKELLLRKENPFENSCKMLEKSVKFEIKQEKEENVMVNQNGNSLLEKLCSVKKEAESPVKFVRTVSKSFEELGLSKTKNGLFSRINRNEGGIPLDSDSLFENFPKAELVDTASQTQTEPHLTGCIVKVLNVPPSTTANDVLALFSPFGTVREVKLNFPKENSVAIRFAEPKSAENFFKLYNGRVFDSHILNVIIV